MTSFQFIVLILFILTCIAVTYFNSMQMVRLRARRDHFMLLSSAFMAAVNEMPEEQKTESLKYLYTLGLETFNLNKLKKG